MKVSFVTILYMFSLNLIALPLPHSAKNRIEKIRETKGNQISITKDCENLTGQWVGFCTDDNGETYERVLTVEQQSCESVEFYYNNYRSHHYFFGGSSLEETLMPQASIDKTLTYLNWDSELNGYIFRTDYSVKYLDTNSSTSFHMDHFIKKSGEQISTRTNIHGAQYFGDMSFPLEYWETCSLVSQK